MRKSTRTVSKTARAQQAEPELEEEDPAMATVKVTSANKAEDIYIHEEEEAAFIRREEEEESDEDGEEEEADEDHRDKEGEQDAEEDEDEDNKPELVPVIPQKRKKGKDTKKPASKPFHSVYSSVCRFSCMDRKNDRNRTERNRKRPDQRLRLPHFQIGWVAGCLTQRISKNHHKPVAIGCNRSCHGIYIGQYIQYNIYITI
jgi:hypothetical protein